MTDHPDRVVAVDVGLYSGGLVWADPGLDGTRTHNLYWSDAKFEYGLIAVRPPEVIVNLARGLVCASL
jgi:hypothetical protein